MSLSVSVDRVDVCLTLRRCLSQWGRALCVAVCQCRPCRCVFDAASLPVAVGPCAVCRRLSVSTV